MSILALDDIWTWQSPAKCPGLPETSSLIRPRGESLGSGNDSPGTKWRVKIDRPGIWGKIFAYMFWLEWI